MPNRIIKESIRTSKKVNALSDFQFRLWLYLITYVDDYGRGSADPELLKGLVFPRRKGITEAQISEALSSLANTGMVTLYEADGEPYLYFSNWSDHQRIQTKHSKFPIPPEPTVNHREPPPESNPIQSNIESKSESESKPITPPSPARESDLIDSDLARAMQFYSENISKAIPSSVTTTSIKSFISELGVDIVLHAMQIAAEAEAHDWRYAKKILERYRDSGFRTMEAVLEDEAKAKQRKSGWGRPAKTAAPTPQEPRDERKTIDQMRRLREKIVQGGNDG